MSIRVLCFFHILAAISWWWPWLCVVLCFVGNVLMFCCLFALVSKYLFSRAYFYGVAGSMLFRCLLIHSLCIDWLIDWSIDRLLVDWLFGFMWSRLSVLLDLVTCTHERCDPCELLLSLRGFVKLISVMVSFRSSFLFRLSTETALRWLKTAPSRSMCDTHRENLAHETV